MSKQKNVAYNEKKGSQFGTVNNSNVQIIVKNFKTSINMSKNLKEKIDTVSEWKKNLCGEMITIKVM